MVGETRIKAISTVSKSERLLLAITFIKLNATCRRDRNGNSLMILSQKLKQNHIKRHCDPALMRI